MYYMEKKKHDNKEHLGWPWCFQRPSSLSYQEECYQPSWSMCIDRIGHAVIGSHVMMQP